ncbi:hypothetical protein CHELA20_54426 [Hyphomicrobiales bacterium]|nr:hypothetical protein CHELA41_20502 [Hyphomicrobiales bacterium]CAH1686240.1 hypothetical protein CHELA20_54426 [Hyphomicrobiales bacterium]
MVIGRSAACAPATAAKPAALPSKRLLISFIVNLRCPNLLQSACVVQFVLGSPESEDKQLHCGRLAATQSIRIIGVIDETQLVSIINYLSSQ